MDDDHPYRDRDRGGARRGSQRDRGGLPGGARYRPVERERLDVAFASPEEWWACQWSHGQRAALERMPESALASYRAAAFVEFERARGPDGAAHWQPEILLALAQAA
jgi:hypothetical protein